MRAVAILALLLAVPVAVSAGELVLTNGTRIAAELATDVLLVSTGADLVEVAPEQVVLLTPSEIRLRDGRVLAGTLVGGRLRTRTALGELTVRLEDLAAFRAEPAATPTRDPAPIMAAAPRPAGSAGSDGPGQVTAGTREVGRGVRDTAVGIGRTVVEAADRAHDGFKAIGIAIWKAMRSVGDAVRDAFTGGPDG
jgi:hypothetical protein